MTLKTAVIGVGAMGRNHARIYADMPNSTLVGVADKTNEVAAEIGRKYNCKHYEDYRQLLDDLQPDVATLAVPTVDHLNTAIEIINRGIHLLIEKPIAFSIEEGEKIITAAEEAGTKLMIGHIERFNPAVLALKEHLSRGNLGQVFQIDARRQGPFPERVKDVGVVIDLAVHDLDVMRYVTGSEVIRAYAETEKRIHETHEDLLTGLVRLGDGAVGTLTINWLTPTKIRELCVTGEKGMYRVDYLTQDLYFFENATSDSLTWDTMQILRGVSEGRMIRHVVTKREPLLLEQEAFLAAVMNNTSVPVNGRDGLKALQLAHALVTSGLEHRSVDLSNKLDQ